MNANTTLRDLGIERLHDAPSGQILLDDPSTYVVLEHEDEGQREFILCQGPSGDVDCLVRDITGDRLYRDCGRDTIDEFKRDF